MVCEPPVIRAVAYPLCTVSLSVWPRRQSSDGMLTLLLTLLCSLVDANIITDMDSMVLLVAWP